MSRISQKTIEYALRLKINYISNLGCKSNLQGHGLGRRVIEELLQTPPVVGVERMHLMTTTSAGFYRQLGFQDANPQ